MSVYILDIVDKTEAFFINEVASHILRRNAFAIMD